MEFFRRLKLRCLWSWHGVVATWRTEYSFRSWVWANLVSAALALALPLSPVERALILALGVLILIYRDLKRRAPLPRWADGRPWPGLAPRRSRDSGSVSRHRRV